MVVQCQKCLTKFKLPDEKVSPAGTKVRCGKCGNTFRVVPAKKPAPIADEATRIAPSSAFEEYEKEMAAAEQPAAPAPAAPPARPAPPSTPKAPSRPFVPKNPFLDEPAPAPRATPADARPKPQSGEKREFYVPPAAPEGVAAPSQAPAPGFFGNETVVAPAVGGADLDSIMSSIASTPSIGGAPNVPGPASPAPSPAEFDVDMDADVPAPPPARQATASPFGEATNVVQTGSGITGEIDSLLASIPSAPPAPAKSAPRPLSGEKREFVVPSVPHGQDPVVASAAPAPAQGSHGDVDVDTLFDGLFVKDEQRGAAPQAEAEEMEPSPGPAQGEDRWADLGADLIGGTGIATDDLLSHAQAAPAPAPATAPPEPGDEPGAAVDALAGMHADMGNDLARSLQDEINRQFEMHFGEAAKPAPAQGGAQSRPAPAQQAAAAPTSDSPPLAAAFEFVQPGAPAAQPPRAAAENPFAVPFAVGIGSNSLELDLPPLPAPAAPPPVSAPQPGAVAPTMSLPTAPQADAFGQPFGAGPAASPSNPFLQVPQPISSPATMTLPPAPSAQSSDLLPGIPEPPPALGQSDPFAGFDLSAPVGTAPAPKGGAAMPAKFAGPQAGPGASAEIPAPGFSPAENDLFAQLDSIGGGPEDTGLGPKIEQLPVRQGEAVDPALAAGVGMDFDTGSAASFAQNAADVAAASAASGVALSPAAVQHARPVIAKTGPVASAGPAVSARIEVQKSPFAAAIPWVFTVLLLVGAVGLLGLRNGKFAAGNVITNLSPASAGTLNKYSVQGFKLYTTHNGKKVGVVTGNVKPVGAVDPGAIRIAFSLADYAGFVAFKGEFFPAKPLTPEEIYELPSQDEAFKALEAHRLKTAAGGWIPFQAIFFDPPERLERFAFQIDVTGVQ